MKQRAYRGIALLLLASLLVFSLSSCWVLPQIFLDEDKTTESSELSSPEEMTAQQSSPGPSGLPENEATEFNFAVRVPASDTPGTVAAVTAAVRDTVVEIYTEGGAGSGVIISKNGVVLTCNHVIEGASEIEIVTTKGDVYTASLIGSDVWTDLAILLIDSENEFPFATFARSQATGTRCIALGETVIAIGNSLGFLGGSVTSGVVAGLDRDIVVEGVPMSLIQTDATVSSGNSGGGLFNLYGELVGIVNAKVDNKSQSTNALVGDIACAIPSDTAIAVVEELAEKGYVAGRPTLGIVYQPSTSYYLTVSRYLYPDELAALNPNNTSFAFQNGDIIIGVDQTEVASLADIRYAIINKDIGDTVTLSVYRRSGWNSGKTYTVTVRIHEYEK